MKTPEIIKNIFSDKDFNELKNYLKNHELLKKVSFDENGRRGVHSVNDPALNEYSLKLLPIARSFFESQTLETSYTLFTEYSDTNINLPKHKDLNACTYTIDLVLYQDKAWGLWVDGVEYLVNENEALFFYGEDQEHWRETVENNNNIVGVIFFHYVEPDHWYFTKGPEYVRELIKIKQQELGMLA
jgi:hypothetical protein